MKRLVSLTLCFGLLLCLFSCSQKPITDEKLEKDYDLLDTPALEMYLEAIDTLTSGTISFVSSQQAKGVKTTVYFAPADNGEKVVLSEIKYTDGSTYNYFDGTDLYLITDGEGTCVDASYLDTQVLYRNYLGAPEDTINADATVTSNAYQKKDGSGYLIVIGTDYGDGGYTKINVYLDENKSPTKLYIFDGYTDIDGNDVEVCVTMTYSDLGEEISIPVPEFTLVSE